MTERKDVYMSPSDWEPYEFEAEIECPHCHTKDTYYSHEIIFDKDLHCDYCDKDFRVICEP